ncbi:MAG: hypothetical protein IJT63_05500 [Lachnospiraceae bacterium]|nr:hypothetical protein [Lachnospiraceae bacterium]
MEVMFQDRYAVICQINPHNRSICYWRNNLSEKDFRREGDRLIFEDSGSYSGLDVELRVCVEKDHFKMIFHDQRQGEVTFHGHPEHFGIMIRMRTDIFPKVCRGSGNGFQYEFSMGGTDKGLSYKNRSNSGKRDRRREYKGAEKIENIKEMMKNENKFEKEAG